MRLRADGNALNGRSKGMTRPRDPDPAYTITVAKELCQHDSVSGAEGEISDWVAQTLSALGAVVEVQEVLPGRRNVIATLDTGRPGPRLLFNGHLDTLPIPAGYTVDPFVSFEREGRLHGAEINNMKGAVAAMISAMRRLSQDREALCGTIILSAVMGECDSLGHGTLSMLEAGLRADMAINGEPTDLQVMTCHNGVSQLSIRATGAGVHVCRKAEGRNALDELLPALAGLDESCLTFTPHPDFEGLPTINIGVIRGGNMPSILAAEAEALVDVRTVPGMTPESVLADVKRHIESARTRADQAPDVEVHLLERPVFCQQYPYQVDPDHPVVMAIAAAHAERTGALPHIGPLFPQIFFGTDASHLSRAGIPTVIYGPGKVTEINVADESMAIADLTRAADVYCAAARSICGAR
jgi:acetylornithine deacetylase/succinyl-diaminopimelate desuccinylase-like protein